MRALPLLPLLGAAAAATMAGCSGSPAATGAPGTGSGGDLAGLVLPAGPAGYRLSVDTALGADDVAVATSSDPHALARTLAQTGFRGGYMRVWTQADAYVSVVAVTTGTAFGAQTLVQFQSEQLTAARGVVPYTDADIPGAHAFDFFGTTRQGARQVFCEGVLFGVDADVFMVDDCNPAPRSADRVLAAARAQYVRASAALGVPVVSASPTPS